jgi:hypothetical protein
MNLLWLIFAHYIGDVALQSNWQADNKAKQWYVMFCHVMVYTAVISFALQYVGLLKLWKIAFIFVGHFICDEIKSHQPREETKSVPEYSVSLIRRILGADYFTSYKTKVVSNWWMIYPDQAWHIIQLLIIFFIK